MNDFPLIKSLAFTPIVFFVEKYVFNDWNFIVSILLLLILDGLTLVILALVKENYTVIEGLTEFGKKTFATTMTVICLGIIDLASVKIEAGIVIDWINSGFYSVLLGFLGVGILNTIYKIYPWEPIKYLLDKFEMKRKEKIGQDETNGKF